MLQPPFATHHYRERDCECNAIATLCHYQPADPSGQSTGNLAIRAPVWWKIPSLIQVAAGLEAKIFGGTNLDQVLSDFQSSSRCLRAEMPRARNIGPSEADGNDSNQKATLHG